MVTHVWLDLTQDVPILTKPLPRKIEPNSGGTRHPRGRGTHYRPTEDGRTDPRPALRGSRVEGGAMHERSGRRLHPRTASAFRLPRVATGSRRAPCRSTRRSSSRSSSPTCPEHVRCQPDCAGDLATAPPPQDCLRRQPEVPGETPGSWRSRPFMSAMRLLDRGPRPELDSVWRAGGHAGGGVRRCCTASNAAARASSVWAGSRLSALTQTRVMTRRGPARTARLVPQPGSDTGPPSQRNTSASGNPCRTSQTSEPATEPLRARVKVQTAS